MTTLIREFVRAQRKAEILYTLTHFLNEDGYEYTQLKAWGVTISKLSWTFSRSVFVSGRIDAPGRETAYATCAYFEPAYAEQTLSS